MLRNYFQIEKTKNGIFIAEGKGTDGPKDYDQTTNWNEWEKVEDEATLFTKITKLLNK